jgi:hypothetical protein
MPLYIFELCLYAGYTMQPMQWLLIDSRVRTEGYISKLGLSVSGSSSHHSPALRGAKWSTASPSISNAWEIITITHRIVEFVSLRAGLDDLGKSKLLVLLTVDPHFHTVLNILRYFFVFIASM